VYRKCIENMDRNCTKCKYPWVCDESDLKKDGTYCRMCKKCREKRSVYVEKNYDLFNKRFLCDCGGTYVKRHHYRHLETDQHKKFEDPEYISPLILRIKEMMKNKKEEEK